MNCERGVHLLLLLGLTACAPPETPVEIRFDARTGGESVRCDTASPSLHMTDLRFYVSEPALIRSDGGEVSVTLTTDGRWQQADLALIDLENGAGECLNGTPGVNDRLVGTVPDGDYEALSFVVGVPFERNHADPLAASAPLDDSTMHWHWRTGYKFLRAGVGTAEDGFWLHLGSAGCEGTVRNISGCKFPNRVSVTLSGYMPGNVVEIDLDAFATAANLDDTDVSDCVSGPGDEDCGPAFAVLGIDHESGTMSGMQHLFKLSTQ